MPISSRSADQFEMDLQRAIGFTGPAVSRGEGDPVFVGGGLAGAEADSWKGVVDERMPYVHLHATPVRKVTGRWIDRTTRLASCMEEVVSID